MPHLYRWDAQLFYPPMRVSSNRELTSQEWSNRELTSQEWNNRELTSQEWNNRELINRATGNWVGVSYYYYYLKFLSLLTFILLSFIILSFNLS